MTITTKLRSWKKNLKYQWFATLYVALIGFLVSVILARELGVENFGNYSFILSLGLIFAIIQDGGYKTLIFRESIDNSSHPLIPFAFAHVIFVTILGILILILLEPQYFIELLTVFCCMCLVILTSFVSSFLKGRGDFKYDAIWQITIRSLTACVILLVLFFYDNSSITLLFLGWSVALLFVLIWPVMKGILKWPKFNFQLEIFRSSMVFLTIDLATVLYFRSDIVLLEYFGTIKSDVGQYSAASRVIEGLILLATPIAQISFRNLRLKKSKKEFFTLLYQLLFLMLSIAFFITLIGGFYGEIFMLFVFGQEYLHAGQLLPILLFALLFILPNYILTQSTIALNKELFFAKIVLFVAFLNILLNLLVIPIYGAQGAAWTTIFSEGVLFLCLGGYMLKAGVNNANRS